MADVFKAALKPLLDALSVNVRWGILCVAAGGCAMYLGNRAAACKDGLELAAFGLTVLLPSILFALAIWLCAPPRRPGGTSRSRAGRRR